LLFFERFTLTDLRFFLMGHLKRPALDATDDMQCHLHGTDGNALAAGR
jgi:hypothetical protein